MGFHMRDNEFHTVRGISPAEEILACQESLCSVNLGDKRKKSYCSTVHFRRITSNYQPTNAHIISYKTL